MAKVNLAVIAASTLDQITVHMMSFKITFSDANDTTAQQDMVAGMVQALLCVGFIFVDINATSDNNMLQLD